jgi:ectoine hydroxylase-related dioxygenase (phytanoyl-CoA dioxygenase family)
MSLTHEQVRLFRHNGFIKLKDRLPEETVARLKEAAWKDLRGAVEPVVRDREGRVVRLSNIFDRDPIFRETAASPTVLDALESLLGPNIELVKNRHNHIQLRPPSANPDHLHRDVLQWTRGIVTVIFYLEESTVEKGCTQVIPGSHTLPCSGGHNMDEEEWVRQSGVLDQTVQVPMPAGGMLAIDSTILHGALKNNSGEIRMSMTVGYHSVDELSDGESAKCHLVRGQRIYKGNDNY